MNKDLIEVIVKDNKEIVLPDIINYAQKSFLTIYKKDQNNNTPIMQTYFKISGLNSTYSTDEFGKIELSLDNKCYQINEVQASPGYVLDKRSRKICLNRGDNKSITITNKRKKIVKTGNNYLYVSAGWGLLAFNIIIVAGLFKKKW